MLSYAFKSSDDGVYLHTRSDDKLFNLAHLPAITRVCTVLVRELLFPDDAALVSHTPAGLQNRLNHVAHACNQFGLTISLKKTEIMAQGSPTVTIGDYTLKVVDDFTYLGTTVTSNLSLDSELSKRIGKAAAAIVKLCKRVLENNMLTKATKMSVYRACVLSTLLYRRETWPRTHARSVA